MNQTDAGPTTADRAAADEAHEPPRETSRPTALEWLALVAALVSFPVAVVRAAVNDWMPVGDAALIVLRARDVATSHHPWGPLYVHLLAPFTKVSPDMGTAVGVALFNAVSVVLVWLVVRRLFRPVVLAIVMAGTLMLVATLGLSWLIDVRPQFALVLPFYALLWLSVGMWSGLGWSVPVAVGVASLCAQTDFSYAYQAVLVTLVGGSGFVAVVWRADAGRATLRRVGLWSGVVAVVCWLQPAIDQLFVSGNVGTALRPARGPAGAGFETGVAVMAEGALLPPLWLPGSMGSFLEPGDGLVSPGSAMLVVGMWLVAAGLVWRLGRRRGVVVVQAAGVAAFVALVVAVVAVVQIPESVFGLAARDYFWLWPLGAFVSLVLVAGVGSLPEVVGWSRRAPLVLRWGLPVVVVLAVLALAVLPRYPLDEVARAEAEAQRIGPPLRQQVAEALRWSMTEDVIEVNWGAALFSPYPAVVLIELQREGIDFRFPPGGEIVGDSRCAPTGRHQQLTFLRGHDHEVPAGMRVIAAVKGLSDEELAEYESLQVEFGDHLRADAVAVDRDGVEWFFDTTLADLRGVLDTPGASAAGLAQRLDSWREWGMVFVSPELRSGFDRWVELERRVDSEILSVVFAPANPSAAGDGSC